MTFLVISVSVIVALAVLVLLAALFCYLRVFSVSKRLNRDPHILLEGKQYAEQSGKILPLIDEALLIEYTDVYIESFDGARLHARYYETDKNATTEIMMHGYRSIAIRDFSGGIQLALNSGHNVLLPDQRAHGESEGRCLTFGILERRDCAAWAEYIAKRNGKTAKILLTGISMGAATVLMSAQLELPENVIGIVADSSYTSPKEIICKVIKDMKLPAAPIYPFVKLGARLFGGFDLEECSALDAVKNCRYPVYFIHGEADFFVPCEMGLKLYENCSSEKTLLTVPGAGHGLGFIIDYDAYLKARKEFLGKLTV